MAEPTLVPPGKADKHFQMRPDRQRAGTADNLPPVPLQRRLGTRYLSPTIN